MHRLLILLTESQIPNIWRDMSHVWCERLPDIRFFPYLHIANCSYHILASRKTTAHVRFRVVGSFWPLFIKTQLHVWPFFGASLVIWVPIESLYSMFGLFGAGCHVVSPVTLGTSSLLSLILGFIPVLITFNCIHIKSSSTKERHWSDFNIFKFTVCLN